MKKATVSRLLFAPVLLGCAALAGCATLDGHETDVDELQQQLVPLFTDAEVRELDALEPQLQPPFRLGIAPPLEIVARRDLPWSGPHRPAVEGPARFGAWSRADEERLRAWAERFRALGWIEEVVFLPGALVGKAGGTTDDLLLGLRTAAARNHVDAVLVTQTISSAYGTANPLALLDLTLVGAFIFPGYDLVAQAVVEGLLIDTRNEYLYASARGTHEAKGSSQAVQISVRSGELVDEARGKALDRLGEGLLENAHRAALTAPRTRRTAP